MRIRRDESGQVLVLTALSMTLLLGFMALAIDVGVLFRAKRNLQIAADAAAIAGALEYEYHGSGNVVNVADLAAAANGVTDSTQVTVRPSTSPYHGGTGYIEVVIAQPNPTFFMRIFNRNSVTVAARAVAGITPSPACMYILDPCDANTLILQGNDTIQAPNCGIQVDSNSPNAVCVTGGSSTVNAPYLRVVGGQSPAGNCKGTPSGTTIQSGVQPISDPLNNMLGPDPASQCTTANTVPASTTTVTSSTPIPTSQFSDSSGATASVTCFAASNVTLAGGLTLGTGVSNGIYVFENGVQIGGAVTVNGTMDIYQGTFNQGNSPLTINAPVGRGTYTYNGIALMQPASNTTGQCQQPKAQTQSQSMTGSCAGRSLPITCLQIQFGSGLGNLSGSIYAPWSEVFMQDNGGGVTTANIIAYGLFEQTSSLTITDSYNSANPSSTPLSKVSLVE